MPAATNLQVQKFSDERVRVRAEAIRDLWHAMQDDKAMIDDVYTALSNSPTWTDTRTDGPPHLLVPADILAINAVYDRLITAIGGDPQLAVVLKACVRPVG